MHVVVVWWDLKDSTQTVESLRAYLRDEATKTFSAMPGLRLKLWVSDEETGRWGAVLVWESAEAAAAPLPARAAELIGYPPTQRSSFTVEATVEGLYDIAALAGRGVIYEKYHR
ncbi:hypothetical protein [Microbispora sp. NPDC049633]|uniref:hypothetical protein n=1 Tax=Microbispora sp. NPDC049633 TaxID=3154355 RepID=UPI003448D336